MKIESFRNINKFVNKVHTLLYFGLSSGVKIVGISGTRIDMFDYRENIDDVFIREDFSIVVQGILPEDQLYSSCLTNGSHQTYFLQTKNFANSINIVRIQFKFVIGLCLFIDLFPQTFWTQTCPFVIIIGADIGWRMIVAYYRIFSIKYKVSIPKGAEGPKFP